MRIAAIGLTLSLLPCGMVREAAAQGRAGLVVEIEGPLSAAAGGEALLNASCNQAAAQALTAPGAFLQWLVNGVPRGTGDMFRARSRQPATYRITLNLISEAGGRRVVLARDQHTLTFVERTSEPATPALAARATAPRWVLKNKRDWIEEMRIPEMRTSVTLDGNEYRGVSAMPCVGTADSNIRWNELPDTLEPGATFVVELQQELNLSADPDPTCDPPQLPRATANAKFFVLTEARHERTLDTMTETARSKTDRFSKSKLVQWRIPSGRIRDEMTVEIGGESPAGSASRFHTYELRAVEADKPGPPPAPTPTPVPAEQPAPPGQPPAALRVKLDAPTATLPLGATARVHASATGGRPPYRFFWSIRGVADEYDGQTLPLRLIRTGVHPVEVRVTDAEGKTARDEYKLTAEPPVVRLIKRSPAGNRLFIEETAEFDCELFTRHAARPGEFMFRWRSDAGIVFDPPDGPETKTSARFFKPGKADVWVEVLYRGSEEARYEAVSRSEPVEIQVIPPEFSIAFSIMRPFVGQQVQATVTTRPPINEVEYRWLEWPRNAVILSRSADSREVKFQLKDDAPAEWKVSATLPRFGQTVGEAVAKLSARKYRIMIRGPETTDVIPMIWKPEIGLVPLEGQFAAGQMLLFRAEIAPAPPNGKIMYEWQSASRACAINDPSAPAPIVTFSEVGRHAIALVVRDAGGIELGAAQAFVEVQVGADEIEESARQARAFERKRQTEQKAAALVTEAKALLDEKQYDEAIARYRQSLALLPDPRLEEETRQLESALENRRSRQAEAQRLLHEGELFEASGDLRAALDRYKAGLEAWTLDGVEARIEELERRLERQEADRARAAELEQEGMALEREGQIEEAMARLNESLALHPSPSVESRIAALRDALRRKEQDRQTAARLRREGAALEDEGRLEAALLKYRESLRVWSDDALAEHADQLERKQQEAAHARAAAEKLREEASLLLLKNRMAEAAAKLRESLALSPDPAAEAHLGRVEEEIRRSEAEKMRARELAGEAAQLEEEGRLEEAAARYRDSLAIQSDAEVLQLLSRVETAIREQAARKQAEAAANMLLSEGEALEKEGQPDAALLKYKESFSHRPDNELADRIARLEEWLKDTADARAAAERLREEASVLLLQGRMDEAIAMFKRSIATFPNEQVVQHVRHLEEEAARLSAAREDAARFADEAAEHEAAGLLKEALAAYRKSLTLHPDDQVRDRITALEARGYEEEDRRIRAAVLREEAAASLLENRLDVAIQKYRESLALEPDAALQSRVAKLEGQWRKQQADLADARRLRDEGAVLEEQGQIEKAMARYRAALRLQNDPDLRARISAMDALLRQQKTRQTAEAAARRTREANARKLREDGEKLHRAGKFAEAAAKFKASLDLIPDDLLRQRVLEIERRLEAEEQRLALAAGLRDEAQALLLDQRTKDATDKYRESLSLVPDKALERHVHRLEDQLRKEQSDLATAIRLHTEGTALEKEGRMEEAAARLRESLTLRNDADVRLQLARVEARLRERVASRDAASAAMRARQTAAQRLRADGERLEQAGQVREAVAKYRGSLDVWPDSDLEAHILALEQTASEAEAAHAKASQLEQEGAAVEREGRIREAVAKYRASLEAAPNPVLESRLLALSDRLTEQDKRALQGVELAEKALEMEKAGRLDEAVATYRRSLDLHADSAIQQRLRAVEERLAEQERRIAEATRLRDEGHHARAENRHADALARYRESLTLKPDPEIEQVALFLESEMEEQAQAEMRAAEWAARGDEFERQGTLGEAAAAYRSSLSIRSDEAIQSKLQRIEKDIVARETKRVAAARLLDEAQILRTQDKFKEAIDKYRESLSLWPNQRIEDHVRALEAEMARREKDRELAVRLRREAEVLEQQDKLEDALAKYRESLHFSPDAATEAVVRNLLEQLARRNAHVETANRLWREGIVLVKRGLRAEGLVLLKQSLEFDQQMDRAGAVRDIEHQLALPPPAMPEPQPAVAALPDTPLARAKEPEATAPAPALAPPPPPAPIGTRWKGVVLVGMGKKTLQWPLRVTIGQGNDISGSYVEPDPSSESAEYNIGGVFDPSSGTLYMALQRSGRTQSHKATLIGTMNSPDAAGGQVALSVEDSRAEPLKGIWRLMREPLN